MTPLDIQIIRRAGQVSVDAQLLDGLKPPDLLVVEGEWAPERSVLMQELLRRQIPRPKWPQSLHWDWKKKAPQLQLLETTGFGIVCGQRWQGVMLTKTASCLSRMGQDKGKPVVYIDYVEAAPWNWTIPEIEREGEYRGIGSVLLWRAVKQSFQEGFHGRVGLHALPQAQQFYEKAGMTPLGRDPAKHDLLYFELSRSNAESLIEGERS